MAYISIQMFYNWAVEHGLENYELRKTFNDEFPTLSESVDMDYIKVDDDKGIVTLL